MTNLLFTFLQYRISMLFLLVFQLLFLPLRYRKVKSIGIAAICFIITGVLDYISFLQSMDWGISYWRLVSRSL